MIWIFLDEEVLPEARAKYRRAKYRSDVSELMTADLDPADT